MSIIKNITQTPLKMWAFLAISVAIDFGQSLLNAGLVLCTIPSVSGIGIMVTLGCFGSAILFSVSASIVWFLLVKFVLQNKYGGGWIPILLGLFEMIPGVNILPTFTIFALYNIIFVNKKKLK